MMIKMSFVTLILTVIVYQQPRIAAAASGDSNCQSFPKTESALRTLYVDGQSVSVSKADADLVLKEYCDASTTLLSDLNKAGRTLTLQSLDEIGPEIVAEMLKQSANSEKASSAKTLLRDRYGLGNNWSFPSPRKLVLLTVVCHPSVCGKPLDSYRVNGNLYDRADRLWLEAGPIKLDGLRQDVGVCSAAGTLKYPEPSVVTCK